ncbi:MAG: decaprenyl-phosphate phosphoribosyltransferase [Ignavibacteriales bacterium]|nr:decaprenyl-phosphate phosphoribosyltransferase [Ignavibacteriales bacterium]
MFRSLIVSIRPQQWIKNIFLFAALVFSKHLLSSQEVLFVFQGFLVFSFLSSGTYLLNDVADKEQDKLHPEKQRRPIASGALSTSLAISFAFVFLSLGIVWAFRLQQQFGFVAISYFVLNILYSWKLKHIVILDVMVIATGFVLRVLAGAMLINVPASEWLLICTFLLSLFLGFVKRRNEITTLNETAEAHRKVLTHYSVDFLDQMVNIVTACTVMSYALYTISQETIQKFQTHNLIYTVPFVLFGIFRYLYIVHKLGGGGNPSRVIVTDVPLIVNVIAWICTVVYIIYL